MALVVCSLQFSLYLEAKKKLSNLIRASSQASSKHARANVLGNHIRLKQRLRLKVLKGI